MFSFLFLSNKSKLFLMYLQQFSKTFGFNEKAKILAFYFASSQFDLIVVFCSFRTFKRHLGTFSIQNSELEDFCKY